MKIKCIIVSAICILVSFFAYAQDRTKCLVLLKNDQSTVYFPLSDEPKITFSLSENVQFIYGVMIVETETEKLIVETSDQNKMEIMDLIESEIKPVLMSDCIQVRGNDIIVETRTPGLSYSVVDMNGMIVKKGILPLGISSISLSTLHSGTYIVAIESQIIKVNVR